MTCDMKGQGQIFLDTLLS